MTVTYIIAQASAVFDYETPVCGVIDIVDFRLQVQVTEKDGRVIPKYKGSFHALATIYREEGPLGLYRVSLLANASSRAFMYSHKTVCMRPHYKNTH